MEEETDSSNCIELADEAEGENEMGIATEVPARPEEDPTKMLAD